MQSENIMESMKQEPLQTFAKCLLIAVTCAHIGISVGHTQESSPETSMAAFVTGKNLLDKTYVVDRTRGILVGMPRLIQMGVKYAFN